MQQGDALGPLLFALALHPALQAARAGPAPPSLALAFLDDVCLAGDYRHVAASLARLAAAARQVGLELNPSKCELVVCGGADHCVDTSLFPAGVQVNSRGAFSFLGAPIGPPAYCEAFCLAERVEKAKPLLALLATLPDSQTALLLLRHCASFCRVAYSARVTPPSLHCNALAVFDGAVRACLESVCTDPLAAEAWVQCTLATSVGGLGLRRCAWPAGTRLPRTSPRLSALPPPASRWIRATTLPTTQPTLPQSLPITRMSCPRTTCLSLCRLTHDSASCRRHWRPGRAAKPLEPTSTCCSNQGQARGCMLLPVKLSGFMLSHGFSVLWSSCACAWQLYRLMLPALSVMA